MAEWKIDITKAVEEIIEKLNAEGYTEKIWQMQETIERLDSENHKLTEKLEEIGTAFNEQVSLVGWHEEREKEYKRLLKQAVEDIRKLGNPGGDCLYLGGCKNCPLYKDQASECRCWNRETEALELIGDERNEP